MPADTVTAATRSRMMAAVKGKNTKPELAIRSGLHRRGFRFRLHRKDLPGKPDLVFAGRCAVIFVHGCFWHRHQGCKYAYTPKSRVEFWQKKFNNNTQRDTVVQYELQSKGIKCLIIWECTIKKMMRDSSTKSLIIEKCMHFLENDEIMISL